MDGEGKSTTVNNVQQEEIKPTQNLRDDVQIETGQNVQDEGDKVRSQTAHHENVAKQPAPKKMIKMKARSGGKNNIIGRREETNVGEDRRCVPYL